MSEQRPWHRYFGLAWSDFFHGQPPSVEAEKDLSAKKQLLDLLIINRGTGPLNLVLPDGFEGLAPYTVISFKSFREHLSEGNLEELIGHGVNVRKQLGPSMDERDWLPRDHLRLYAVCVRFPRGLVAEGVTLEPVQAGVYQVRIFTRYIRVIVINELPQQEHNAMLLLFSNEPALFSYGILHYRVQSAETSTLLLELLERYQTEGLTMPDSLKKLHEETIARLFRELPPEVIFKNMPVQKILEQVSLQQRLEGVSVEQRLEGVPVDDLLAALSPQARAALARRLQSPGGQADQS